MLRISAGKHNTLLSHSFKLVHIITATYSEGWLASFNKYVRRFRENLSRKPSFEDNVNDILLILTCSNHPAFVENRFRRKGTVGHSINSIQYTYSSILMESYQ